MENETLGEIRSQDELHSNELKEIVTVVPSWILRWGMSLVFCLLMLIVMGAAFVDYPETINADLKIRMISPPHQVKVSKEGKIAHVLVRNGEYVKKGQILCFLDNAASAKDILTILKVTELLKSDLATGKIPTCLPANLSLGELTVAYQKLSSSFSKYWLLNRSSHITGSNSLISADLGSFSKRLDNYLKDYTLRASSQGVVRFSGVFMQGQQVTPGDELLVIDSNEDSYFGEMYITQEKLPKIKIGQDILVELKGYPLQQFGFLKGKITYLSDVLHKDSVYIGTVSLGPLQGGKASRMVSIKNGMGASAKITIEQTSLLKKLVKNMTRAMKNI